MDIQKNYLNKSNSDRWELTLQDLRQWKDSRRKSRKPINCEKAPGEWGHPKHTRWYRWNQRKYFWKSYATYSKERQTQTANGTKPWQNANTRRATHLIQTSGELYVSRTWVWDWWPASWMHDYPSDTETWSEDEVKITTRTRMPGRTILYTLVRSALATRRYHNQPTWTLFVDLVKAFDTVNHSSKYSNDTEYQKK